MKFKLVGIAIVVIVVLSVGLGWRLLPELTRFQQSEQPEQPEPEQPETPEQPKILGFSFSLEKGTYWHYYWTYEKTSYAQGGSGGRSTVTGDFKVTLDDPIEIGGVKAYKVETSGDTSDPDFEYAPCWTHLAVSESQILGSDDNGASLKVIFDARTGEWQGGGFFREFPDDFQVAATQTRLSNEYISTSAYSVGQSKSEGKGFYDPETGVTVPPSGEQYSIDWNEYYKGGLGPIGYYYYKSWSSDKAGFYTSFTYKRNLGLVASSLTATDGFVPKFPPWIKKAPMPTPRYGIAASVVDGIIYTIGGTVAPTYDRVTTVEAYDPATDTWTTKASLPVPRSRITSVAMDKLIYVVGEDARLDVYDTRVDAWLSGYPDAPKALYNIQAVVFGRYMIVTNGGTIMAYDTLSNEWLYGISHPHSQDAGAPGVAATSTHVYVVGDYEYGYWGGAQGTTYRYDPYETDETKAWVRVASMNRPRTYAQCVVLNGMVYAIGGYEGQGEGCLRYVEAYDASTDKWTEKSNMPRTRASFAVAVVNGKIYAIGGEKLGIVDEYDPTAE